MRVNFPDRDRIRIDTFHIGRTMAGWYEGISEERRKELGVPEYQERVLKSLEEQGRKIWGHRDNVTYRALPERGQGPWSVWVWLEHSEPLKDPDTDGSHAFLVFTCDLIPEDQSIRSVVQNVIDGAELRWADIGRDYEI